MLNKILKIRDNISIRKRLIATAISVSFFLLLIVIILYLSISSMNKNIVETNNIHTKNLINLSDFIENIYSIIIKSHIISENSINDATVDNTLQIDLLDNYLSNFNKNVDESLKETYDKLIFECRNYISIVKEINSLELQGKYKQASIVKNEKELKSFNELHYIIKSLLKSNNENIKYSNLQIIKHNNFFLNSIFIVGIITIILSLLFFIFVFGGLKLHLNKIVNNIEMLNKGQIPSEHLNTNKNELGEISKMINSLTINISKWNNFATALSRGEYTSEYDNNSKDNLLATALINLRDNLHISKKADTQRKLEDDIRNWTNSGHALFGEILRQRSQGIKQLADDIIKNIVRYLSANQGGLFIINDDTLELISSFAYDRKKFVERKIKVGDGLIGTVAMDKNTMFLDDIPDNYIEIESGLGDSSPNNLLIVPLKYEDKVLGVVEIASFKKIQEHEIKFVEKLGQSIASTLLTVKINEQTEQLLNDSQKKSKELALREIEARNNMEKMKATQELAKRREADLTGILSAVDNTLMKGEYELDGTLISANDRHLQTMGYQLREIKGKNIEIFIPEKELEDFRKMWASVIGGTTRQVEVQRKTKTGETLWLINQFTPVNNAFGEISKVLYLAHDVTRYKIHTDSTLHDNIKQSEDLEEEIIEKKKDLKRIELEMNILNKQIDAKINKFTDSDVQKKYVQWLNSI